MVSLLVNCFDLLLRAWGNLLNLKLKKGGIVEKQSIEDSGNLAVVLIDMQKIFVKSLRYGEANRIVAKQLVVLKHCVKAKIPVVVLELGSCFYGNTIEVLLEEAQKTPNFCVFEKCYNSGFYKTKLDLYLRSIGVENLLLMGINADYCVKSTAEHAIHLGYQIITSNEVISGQDSHSRNNSIDWFKSNGNCIDNILEFSMSV